MLHLHHRVVVDDRHLDAVGHHLVHLHLVYLIYMVMMMVLIHLDVEKIHHLLVVAHQDVQQILDEQSLDVNQPFLDVVHLHLEGVAVDAVLRHQLKMDYFLDEVGVELHRLQRMDCFLDEALKELVQQASHYFLLHALLLHSSQPPPYLLAP
jgi:hypothetical protein